MDRSPHESCGRAAQERYSLTLRTRPAPNPARHDRPPDPDSDRAGARGCVFFFPPAPPSGPVVSVCVYRYPLLLLEFTAYNVPLFLYLYHSVMGRYIGVERGYQSIRLPEGSPQRDSSPDRVVCSSKREKVPVNITLQRPTQPSSPAQTVSLLNFARRDFGMFRVLRPKFSPSRQ